MYENMKTERTMDAVPVPTKETVGSQIAQTYDALKTTLCALDAIRRTIYGGGNMPEFNDDFCCMMDVLAEVRALTIMCRDLAEHIKEGL